MSGTLHQLGGQKQHPNEISSLLLGDPDPPGGRLLTLQASGRIPVQMRLTGRVRPVLHWAAVGRLMRRERSTTCSVLSGARGGWCFAKGDLQMCNKQTKRYLNSFVINKATDWLYQLWWGFGAMETLLPCKGDINYITTGEIAWHCLLNLIFFFIL